MLNFQLEGVKTYVICAGMLYGAGEDSLELFFKSAWLQNPLSLPVPGDGSNLVPSIHVADLVTFMLRIADNPPEQKYHFAFDCNKDRSLLKIIKDVSVVAGSGAVENVDSTDLLKPQFSSIMCIDFWALPSEMLSAVPIMFTEAGIEKLVQQRLNPDPPAEPTGDPAAGDDVPGDADDKDQQEEPEPEPEDPEFEWVSKRGVGETGKPILAEFCKQHGR